MKTTQKKLANNIIEITLEDTPKAYEQARKEAIVNFGKRVQVKGFRKGANIPETLIIKEVGEAQIADAALDNYLRGIYPKLLSETKVSPVAPGQVTKIVSLDPLVIILEIEVLPEVTLDMKEIKKVSLKKTEVTLEKNEVEEAIKEIEKRFTHFHPAGGTSEDGFTSDSVVIAVGDRVTIDTQGFESQGGSAIEETHVTSFPLVIGSGQFIPGFEEKLIGHKAGEVVEFDITFPADYHSEKFKGKKVFFMTTVFQVEKPHTPEWTPDFIEKLRGVKTDIAGFKEILEKEIIGEKERRAREADEKTLLESLEKSATLEMGKAILQKEVENIFNEQKSHMESQGFSMKLYLEHIKMSEDAYRAEVITPEAERRVRAELILKALKDEMKIEATDTEIQLEINGVIAQYQNEQVIERLKAKLIPGDTYYEDIKTRLAYRKVVDSFFTK